METVEYAPGRSVDVHPGRGQGHVLIWHGRGPNSRTALETLAGLVADRGPTVVAPDWSSEADDGGRADLLQSMRFARGAVEAAGSDPASLVLVGWSLGGTAAAGLTVHARRLGIGIAHTVCLAGGFVALDPISGEILTGEHVSGPSASPFTLMHGIADDISPVSMSRSFGQMLEQAQWPVTVIELPTDHGGIVGTFLDDARENWLPSTDPATQAVVAEVADRIAALTSSPPR